MHNSRDTVQLTYFPGPQELRFIFITNRKLSCFQKNKVYTDSFMLYAFLLLWSSTLQLLSLICSSGEEILNITSSQQRLDNNYQQMSGSSFLRELEREKEIALPSKMRSLKQLIDDSFS